MRFAIAGQARNDGICFFIDTEEVMNIRVYFLKPLLVFLFSSFIFACAEDDTETYYYTPTSIISAHPQSADCNQDSTATLNVTASGRSLTYQWYSNTANSNKGGTPIGGATASSYRLPTGTLGTFYYYVVVVTDTYSKAISNVAVINVTPVRYIEIYNAADLYNIRNNLSADYKLMNNISLSDYSTGAGWEPIGTFSGSLDGGGYRITDLYVNTVGTPAGIFGRLTGRVKDLGVEIGAGGVTARSSSSSPYRGIAGYAGGIAGYVDGGAITNSYTTGYVSSTTTATSPSNYPSSSSYSYAGGIAGYVDNGTISGSYSTGYVSSSVSSSNSYSYSYSYTGGIAGYVSGGVISGSHSTGYVSSASNSNTSSHLYSSSPFPASYAGGIAGYVNGTVSGSYSTGDISSTSTSTASYSTDSSYSYAGGIAGAVSGAVSGSHSTGSISSYASSSYAGGITGYLSGTVNGSYSTGGISGTTFSSSTSSSPSYTGGIAGYVKGIISISYATGDISSTSTAYNSSTYAGGIVGYIDGIAIMGCYATGYVSSSVSSSNSYYSYSYTGGIAGYANNVSITGCAAANGYVETIAGTTYKGRIAGSINSSLAANNFANRDMLVNSATVSDNTSNGTGKSLAELQTQATYEGAVNGDGLGGLGWEFGNSGGAPVWKMPAGGTGYPEFY
jgi:hypothetical protein